MLLVQGPVTLCTCLQFRQFSVMHLLFCLWVLAWLFSPSPMGSFFLFIQVDLGFVIYSIVWLPWCSIIWIEIMSLEHWLMLDCYWKWIEVLKPLICHDFPLPDPEYTFVLLGMSGSFAWIVFWFCLLFVLGWAIVMDFIFISLMPVFPSRFPPI